MLNDGKTQVAVVCLDLIGLDFTLADEIRAGVRQRIGITTTLLNCSHSHSVPFTIPWSMLGRRWLSGAGAPWRRALVASVIEVVSQAAGDLSPAHLSVGRAPVQIGSNRRLPLVLFGGSTVIMALHVGFFKHANFLPPGKILWMAVFFGALAVLAFWGFLYGLRFGKISTSWVFMNLSAAVPAVLSAVIYKEKIGFRKLMVLSLVVVSILLLWKDMKERTDSSARE